MTACGGPCNRADTGLENPGSRSSCRPERLPNRVHSGNAKLVLHAFGETCDDHRRSRRRTVSEHCPGLPEVRRVLDDEVRNRVQRCWRSCLPCECDSSSAGSWLQYPRWSRHGARDGGRRGRGESGGSRWQRPHSCTGHRPRRRTVGVHRCDLE